MKILFALFGVIVIVSSGTAIAQSSSSPTERLSEYKVDREITLNESEKNIIVATCGNATAILVSTQDKTNSAIKKRQLIYDNIQRELKAMEMRMSKQGVDASEIDLLIGKLQQNLDEMAANNRESQQITDDIKSINCQEQPELYAAGVQKIRLLRERQQQVSSNLKEAVTSSPQDTFIPLIKRLQV
jgi:hypothetical protein